MPGYLDTLDEPRAERPRVVVADPPWKFGDTLPGDKRGAAKHYDVMDADAIARLRIPDVADDAHLFLWRVASMQREALDVVAAWGFDVKSEIVWLKRTKTGKRWFGMGRHVRAEHEVCLICTRGRGAGVRDRSQRSTFTTELYLDDDGGGSFEAVAGEHSRKPDEFYAIVEALVPGPYVELFARRPRPGWQSIGNQLPGSPITLTE